jgi:hypothetical protein
MLVQFFNLAESGREFLLFRQTIQTGLWSGLHFFALQNLFLEYLYWSWLKNVPGAEDCDGG